jgi:thiamine pyrophosphokinase
MPPTRAFIFANGDQFQQDRVQPLVQPGDFLVAADGGLRHLLGLGLAPDLLIGDLDSVSPQDVEWVKQAHGQVVQYPVDKDETDLELALMAALRSGAREIFILGALGGRLDMTLANISLLLLPDLASCNVRLEDGIEEVFLIRAGKTDAVIFGQPGDRVSLLPWGSAAAGITPQGLIYPLKGETLFPDRTRGTSNRMAAEQARVTLESGLLICIHTRRER